MEFVLLILRLLLAGVFGVAGIAKLLDPAGSEKAFSDFGVPRPLARPLGYLLPIAEVVIAISLLFVETSWFGSIAAACLFLVFIGGMLYQMAKGNAPDCHCFGQLHSEPVGLKSVLRNGALLGAAAVLAAFGRDFQGFDLFNSNQNAMQFLIGIAIVGLLATVVFFLKRISEQQALIMRRIELIELVSRQGDAVEREHLAHPNDGLPIGAKFPDFELAAIDGGPTSLKQIRKYQKPVLFLFVSPTCNPCKALVPEFEQWQAALADKVKFVFVSNGTAQDNIEKFSGNASKQILLQKNREVADAAKAQWTPTAILMDATGRIASHAAAGDTAIRQLIEQIKAKDPAREFTFFANGHSNSQTNKIGSEVPQFVLEDIKGRQINTDYFKGKQTLVTFWSPACQHCANMLQDLRKWDETKGEDEPALVLFSDGDKAALEEFGLKSPIILDTGHKFSAGFGMFGTPSAVLVNPDGKIISETATGAPNIWSLVGKQ